MMINSGSLFKPCEKLNTILRLYYMAQTVFYFTIYLSLNTKHTILYEFLPILKLCMKSIGLHILLELITPKLF